LAALIGLLALPVLGQSVDEAGLTPGQGFEAAVAEARNLASVANRRAESAEALARTANEGVQRNSAAIGKLNVRTGRLESEVSKVARDVTGALSQTKQLETNLATVEASANKANEAAADAKVSAESVASDVVALARTVSSTSNSVTSVSETLGSLASHVATVKTIGLAAIIGLAILMVVFRFALSAKLRGLRGDLERGFPVPFMFKVEATDPRGRPHEEEREFRGTEDQLKTWFELRRYENVIVTRITT